MKIVTINREFGSGGREVGKRLAEKLGFAYYDREIIKAISEKSKLDVNYIEKTVEDGYWRNYPIAFNHTFSYMPFMESPNQSLIAFQSEVLKGIASKGNAVIVGRAADTILEDFNPFKIFVYATMESRLQRCRERAPEDENLTDKELIKKIKKIDNARAESHDIISSYRWGDKEGADLMINTSHTENKKIIDPLSKYIEEWFKENN